MEFIRIPDESLVRMGVGSELDRGHAAILTGPISAPTFLIEAPPSRLCNSISRTLHVSFTSLLLRLCCLFFYYYYILLYTQTCLSLFLPSPISFIPPPRPPSPLLGIFLSFFCSRCYSTVYPMYPSLIFFPVTVRDSRRGLSPREISRSGVFVLDSRISLHPVPSDHRLLSRSYHDLYRASSCTSLHQFSLLFRRLAFSNPETYIGLTSHGPYSCRPSALPLFSGRSERAHHRRYERCV